MNMRTKWDVGAIENQKGKVVIVTGANSGIGYETAREMSRRGAEVILACRDEDRGMNAIKNIIEEIPKANLVMAHLDLSDLNQIKKFSDRIHEDYRKIDILINNAGVMMDSLTMTKQGFEFHFGINHLGHFALTGHILDLLLGEENSRVVNVASIAEKKAKIFWNDLNCERRKYSMWGNYSQSKLANLLFTFEFKRQFESIGHPLKIVAAHPGLTATNIMRNMSENRISDLLLRKIAQSQSIGALPILYAAVEDVESGDYIGPDGVMEIRGHPTKVNSSRSARNAISSSKLWKISEDLTGIDFNRER
jgi:NAD(P)-dependent dehydrogenase (short-subunit alcohol dehydrogenase family)